MTTKTQYDFLFLGKNEGGFVENYAYDLGEGGENSGKFFINLDIQQNNFDAEQIGEIIFDTMRKVFFCVFDADAYERFEESLKEINRALNAFRQERGNEYLGKLNVIIAAVVGNALFLTQSGEAEAYLIRKKLATTISDDLDEANAKEVFSNIASGDLEGNDLILLCSTRLIRYITKSDLGKIAGHNLAKTMQELKDHLHGEILSKVGLVGIQVLDQKKMAIADLSKPALAHTKEEGYQNLTIDEAVDTDTKSSNQWLAKAKLLGSKAMNGGRNLMDRIKEQVSSDDEGRGERTKNRFYFTNWGKNQIIAAVVVLVILLSAGVWWLRAKGDEEQKVKEMAAKLSQITETVSSAITTGQYDKARASELLVQAEKEAIEIYNSGYYRAKSREVLDKILETRDQLDGVMRPEVQKVVDLTEKRQNVDALGLVILNKQLFAYEYNALYPILADQAQNPLTIDDNEKVISATSYEDKDSILFYTEAAKILEYKNDRVNFLTTSDAAFKEAQVIKSYKNKIYLLDNKGNQIWRYTRTRDKFESAQAYAVNPNFTKAVDMAIDGNIFVLNNDGSMLKLFQGALQEGFRLLKQPVKPVVSPTKMYTELDMSQIFVLEPGERRVLVYLKDDRTGNAVYSTQFLFDELGELRDIVVDKDTNTAYLLTKTSIYKFKY